MAAPYVISTLPDVFQAERESFPPGATMWVVTPAVSNSLPTQLAVFADRGYRVSVIFAGDGEPPDKIGECLSSEWGICWTCSQRTILTGGRGLPYQRGSR